MSDTVTCIECGAVFDAEAQDDEFTLDDEGQCECWSCWDGRIREAFKTLRSDLPRPSALIGDALREQADYLRTAAKDRA